MERSNSTASQALRAAEATACTGVSEPDQDMSPFAHAEDILRVEPVLVPGGMAGPSQCLEEQNR